ncbi:MAG: DUF58 domain-containing protein [bacterium]|nr:DUF58 domain-containing protein [bacterium]
MLGYFFLVILVIAKYLFFSIILFSLADMVLLYRRSTGIEARRKVPEKLSNGDMNSITIEAANRYGFPVRLKIIDELPFRFQERGFSLSAGVPAGTQTVLRYTVRPVERGEYRFGALNVFTESPLGLVIRRYRFGRDEMVPVYPSIEQMKKYDIFAISNRLSEVGIKKMRRAETAIEFDRIREYVSGDDYRKINWKASARKTRLMVNQYRDERSQHIYSIIDMGRGMKMPFNGMTLLDYAVNTALVISNIAIRREDKAGLITFSNTIETVLGADKKYSHIFKILEALYNSTTGFLEPDYEQVYSLISRKVTRRSLIILYTNFETLESLRRNIPYLTMISRRHVLVIIFFENTELREYINKPAQTIEKIYTKTIAEKFEFEKRQIVKELDRYGIHSILTSPENLTVKTINKYLELKARGAI